MTEEKMVTIEVSEEAYNILEKLSKETGKTFAELVAEGFEMFKKNFEKKA